MDQLIITETDALSEFCALAASEEYLTIDTEFMREHTYYPKLCLVQIGLQQKAAVIDPLAPGLDLAPLFALLQDARVLKVFHAVRQDLEIFYLMMGTMVTPVYDTQIAAMALGLTEQIAYHTLVKKHLNVDLDKGSRMTQWDKRPLSEAQLHYAFNDVIPLHKIYPIQRTNLKGREEWISEAWQRTCSSEGLSIQPEDAWKLIKFKQLKPRQMGALVAAATWRERYAQQKDLPRRWVLSDESLLVLAQNLPKTVAEAESLRLRPNKVRHLKSLLEAMQLSTPITEPLRPCKAKLSPNKDLLHLLHLALHHCAREQNIAPRLLCSIEELQNLTALTPEQQEWQDHSLQQGWRREVFGVFAEKIARGSIVLRFQNRRMHFEEV